MAGHIQNVLRMYPLGISGSHSGVYLKCTQHLITGHIGVTCCLCSQYFHNVPSGYLGPCPQCEGTNIVLFNMMRLTEPLRPEDFVQTVAVPRPEEATDPSPKPVILLVSSLSMKVKSDRLL